MPRDVPLARRGLTLLQLLLTVTILGTLGAIVLARMTGNTAAAKKNSCYVNKAEIEIQVQLWRRTKGAWPANNLSDIGGNLTYFPSGLPKCPVDGSSYTLDPTTRRVTGHTH